MAERACGPASGPHSSRIRSEKPLITAGVLVKPGAAFTMPNTRSHAVILSRSPRARRRLASVARAVARAASQACSSVTSAPTLPRGSQSEPSGWSGPCPETKARPGHSRTHGKGSTRPAGCFIGSGSSRPSEARRLSMRIASSCRAWSLTRRRARQLADDVQVPEVAGVLLHQMEQDTLQRRGRFAAPPLARPADVVQVVGFDDRPAAPRLFGQLAEQVIEGLRRADVPAVVPPVAPGVTDVATLEPPF